MDLPIEVYNPRLGGWVGGRGGWQYSNFRLTQFDQTCQQWAFRSYCRTILLRAILIQHTQSQVLTNLFPSHIVTSPPVQCNFVTPPATYLWTCCWIGRKAGEHLTHGPTSCDLQIWQFLSLYNHTSRTKETWVFSTPFYEPWPPSSCCAPGRVAPWTASDSWNRSREWGDSMQDY